MTLENYFFSHLNRSETAKALLIHRNTLYLLIDTEKKSRNRDSNKFTT
ncbi:helix-turn-helix domain-containing protein [Paenibacillus alvei]